ncbi:unnamed protein product [Kluyveromyces dobzhanskii CBS 2104]|uniref:Acyl-protein thioesterase 1 n=1 Tax=Kluyveromyces dobzhanskii CBS 2104 TaxID=1427455 RepID=A0A0A8LAT9_9SACH|nr:unnamed protein product [Kluyveromyces dobzhanskii CBS 2104]
MPLNAVRVASRAQPAKNVILVFHGLGDSGAGWTFLADFLQRSPAFANTRFVFPNAPNMKIVANGGALMPAWFNLYDWNNIQAKIDVEGIKDSLKVVNSFIQEQIDDGIAPENIILGGFSQGAALTLASTATSPHKIGGFFALSGFCSLRKEELDPIAKNLNTETPVFHGHGSHDPIIPVQFGVEAKQFFEKHFHLSDYDFKTYYGMEHSTSPEEMQDLVQFLQKALKL